MEAALHVSATPQAFLNLWCAQRRVRLKRQRVERSGLAFNFTATGADGAAILETLMGATTFGDTSVELWVKSRGKLAEKLALLPTHVLDGADVRPQVALARVRGDKAPAFGEVC